MRNFRILFTLLAVMFIAGTASAQNKKVIAKAEKKVSELNEKLSAIDATLVLTDEQKELIQAAYVEGMVAMNKTRKSAETKEAGKEAVKPIRKEMNKKIKKEILTKEQRKALSKSKKEK